MIYFTARDTPTHPSYDNIQPYLKQTVSLVQNDSLPTLFPLSINTSMLVQDKCILLNSLFDPSDEEEGELEVIFDAGNTKSTTFCKDDFVGPILPPKIPMYLNGIAKKLQIEGIGNIERIFQDGHGMIQTVCTQDYYKPEMIIPLLRN